MWLFGKLLPDGLRWVKLVDCRKTHHQRLLVWGELIASAPSSLLQRKNSVRAEETAFRINQKNVAESFRE